MFIHWNGNKSDWNNWGKKIEITREKERCRRRVKKKTNHLSQTNPFEITIVNRMEKSMFTRNRIRNFRIRYGYLTSNHCQCYDKCLHNWMLEHWIPLECCCIECTRVQCFKSTRDNKWNFQFQLAQTLWIQSWGVTLFLAFYCAFLLLALLNVCHFDQ